MKETLDFLKLCGTFYLATVDGNKPRVRPFGAVAEFENKLYIVNNQKKVYAQMLENPKIEISGTHEGTWIRLEAEAVRDTNIRAKEKMLEDNEMLKDIYSLDDGVMEVFYLKNAKASINTFTSEPKEYSF